MAISADTDETPRFVASHLGLRCLHMFPFFFKKNKLIQPVQQMRALSFRLYTHMYQVLVGQSCVLSVDGAMCSAVTRDKMLPSSLEELQLKAY